MEGDNGGLSSATTTFSKAEAHTESTPAAGNPGLFMAGSETRVPDPVEGVGYGVNGGRLMGSLIGDKASAPKTSRLDGGVQGLSTAAYGFDIVVRPIRPGEQSHVPNSGCGEEQGIRLNPEHPAVDGQVLSHGEQVRRNAEGWGSELGGNSGVRIWHLEVEEVSSLLIYRR